MSAKIFQITDWDNDSVPVENFNFKRKANKKKKTKSIQQEKKNYETLGPGPRPGRYVMFQRNVDGNTNREKKRNLTEHEKQNDGGVSHAKKKRIRKGNEGKQPMLKVEKGKDIPFTKKKTKDLDSDSDTAGNQSTDVSQDDPPSFKAYHDAREALQWAISLHVAAIKAIKRVATDFGCGEARLPKSIPQKTYSLDLVAKTNDTIACGVANIPLETGTTRKIMFHLSEIGTNIEDFILEANRVLKDGGPLKIAEVDSRFVDIRRFVANMKQCGFELIHLDLSNSLFYFKKTSKRQK